MKKYVIMAPLLAITATGAFALDIVAGMKLGFSNYANYYYPGYYYDLSATAKSTGFGSFSSLGWKYLDINAGFFWDVATVKREGRGEEIEVTSSAVQLGLYFKFPITFSSRFRLFPTVGADFDFIIDISPDDYIWFTVGGGLGADVVLFQNMFLRTVVMGGYDFFRERDGLVFKVGAGWLL